MRGKGSRTRVRIRTEEQLEPRLGHRPEAYMFSLHQIRNHRRPSHNKNQKVYSEKREKFCRTKNPEKIRYSD